MYNWSLFCTYNKSYSFTHVYFICCVQNPHKYLFVRWSHSSSTLFHQPWKQQQRTLASVRIGEWKWRFADAAKWDTITVLFCRFVHAYADTVMFKYFLLCSHNQKLYYHCYTFTDDHKFASSLCSVTISTIIIIQSSVINIIVTKVYTSPLCQTQVVRASSTRTRAYLTCLEYLRQASTSWGHLQYLICLRVES